MPKYMFVFRNIIIIIFKVFFLKNILKQYIFKKLFLTSTCQNNIKILKNINWK